MCISANRSLASMCRHAGRMAGSFPAMSSRSGDRRVPVSGSKAGTIAPQPWMTAPQPCAVIAALAEAGIVARFVGGCVRDALLGRAIADIDIATPARPEEVIAALEKAGIKPVPTGIEHGTITAVVSTPEPRHFEITTLRRDVETYGRRARVAFDADWAEDAARRDFTINAIYLDPDGTLHDPVGGLADLEAHRVRFVGAPAQRIAEDVLRVLRYYRFEARFGTGTGDPKARAACRAAVPLLSKLSAERVERVRLSNEHGDGLAGLAPPWPLDPAGDTRAQRLTLSRLSAERYRDLALLLAADGALDQPRLAELLALAAAWKPPRFPLKG